MIFFPLNAAPVIPPPGGAGQLCARLFTSITGSASPAVRSRAVPSAGREAALRGAEIPDKRRRSLRRSPKAAPFPTPPTPPPSARGAALCPLPSNPVAVQVERGAGSGLAPPVM